jgi:hypothetical protein
MTSTIRRRRLLSGRRGRLLSGWRGRLLSGLFLATLLGLTACEEASSGLTDSIVEGWRKAGLTPTVFSDLEDEGLKPGKCQQGKVDGLAVVLCEYADAAAAHAAQNTGLGHVGETTGLALAADKLLLIVSDPDKSDPAGRKLNQIATAFRDTLVPPKAEDKAAEDKAGAATDAKAAGDKAPAEKAADKKK